MSSHAVKGALRRVLTRSDSAPAALRLAAASAPALDGPSARTRPRTASGENNRDERPRTRPRRVREVGCRSNSGARCEKLRQHGSPVGAVDSGGMAERAGRYWDRPTLAAVSGDEGFRAEGCGRSSPRKEPGSRLNAPRQHCPALRVKDGRRMEKMAASGVFRHPRPCGPRTAESTERVQSLPMP